MVSKPNLNIKLEQPKEFNAQKLANKKVLGVKVLNSSQRSKVIQGGNDVKKAKGDINGAQKDINEAADDVDRGFEEQDNVNAQAEDAQASAEQGMSAEELDAETENLSQDAELALAKGQVFTELNDVLVTDFADFTDESEGTLELLDTSLEEDNAISEEIESLAEEAEALASKLEGSEQPAGEGADENPAVTGATTPNAAPVAAPVAPQNAPQNAPAVSDGMGGVVNPESDGTGAGLKSAYSLTTGADADAQTNPAPARSMARSSQKGGIITGANPAPQGTTPVQTAAVPATPATVNPTAPVVNTPTTNPAAPVNPANPAGGTTPATGAGNSEVSGDTPADDSNEDVAQLEDLKTKMDELSGRHTELGETITTTSADATANAEAKKEEVQKNAEDADALVEEGNTAQSGLEKTTQILTQANQYGQYTKMAGLATKTVGAGLMGTGLALNMTGGTMSGVGAGICGVGAMLMSVGAPLCALFGIGTPIVGAGGTTTGAGVSVTGGGASLTGAGSGLYSAGQTSREIGEVTEKVGTGVTLAASAGLTGVQISQGNWVGAISSGMSVAASSMSFAQGLGAFTNTAGKVAEGFQTATKVVTAASATFNTAVAAAEGNIGGMVTGGFSMVSAGAGFMDGNAANIVGSAASFANSGFGMYQAIDSGDTLSIIQNGLGVMNSGANLLENAGVNTSVGITAYEGTEYAREPELNPDGTVKTDEQGNVIYKKENDNYVMKRDENGNVIKTKIQRGVEYERGADGNVVYKDGKPVVKTSGSTGSGSTTPTTTPTKSNAPANGSDKPNETKAENGNLDGNNNNASWKADTSKSGTVKFSDITGWTSSAWSEASGLVNTYNTVTGKNNDNGSGSVDEGEVAETKKEEDKKEQQPIDYSTLFGKTSNKYKGIRGTR